MNLHVFREYDIRGVVDKDLTDEFVNKLGKGFGTLVKRKYGKKVSVGGDIRLSTERFRTAIIKGILSTGVDVYDIGRCPTPAQYFSIGHLECDAGVQITGSHNPPDYNGFKMTSKIGSIFGKEIEEIKNIIQDNDFERGSGEAVKFDILTPYIDRIAEDIDLPKRIKIVLDSGNGAAGLVVEKVFDRLNVDASYLFTEPDGLFPNHHPDPTIPENLKDLIQKVQVLDADIGIGFDGDADRIGVVNKAGEIIWGDKLMILYSREVVKNLGNVPIVFDVKCSQSLIEEIEKAGGTPVMWKTGHSLLKQKMKEIKSPLGGEMSGHIFFGDRYLGYDDAIYAAVRTVEIIAKSDKTIEEHLADVKDYVSTPEIRLNIRTDEEKFAIAEKAKQYFSEKHKVNNIDGVRIFFEDGWGLVRASNTQPVIVARFEAQSLQRVEEIKNYVLGKLNEFGEILPDGH